MDAATDDAYGARIVAVGADRDGIEGLARARRAGLPAFVVKLADHPTRSGWDQALRAAIAAHEPDLVVSAGFMKILGPEVLGGFSVVNTHPALLPSFPGAHAVPDALAYGVRVTGCTVHLVDAGVDTGPVIAQEAVAVHDGDDEGSLHERIKIVERRLLVEVVGRMARDGWTVTGRHVRLGDRDRPNQSQPPGSPGIPDRLDTGRSTK
ncbi:phosphoribosylglycinamide formyltransferase [Sphaerisporangium dianthi]|uniref:Phosphoribosylglycinamide formyltransferase n=1 Tax=Sphaerisporangium dianthi TaxID=1436120 RepID=A0ABV9CE26_9ACTN